MSTAPAHVLIIGGGGTGGALAHDLTLRGVKVTLVERGEITSGTTGRHHGLLHSGARYAVGDQESAVECIEENTILRRICPGSFEENDGLFIAVTDEDMEYLEPLMKGCADCGIPTQQLTPDEALRLEPLLNPELKAAVRIPDATMDAMRMPLRFFATARHNGAEIHPYIEVQDLIVHDRVVSGAVVHDHVTGKDGEIHADIVVNATGPWSEKIAAMAGSTCRSAPPPACCSRCAVASATWSSTASTSRATATSWYPSGDSPSSGPARGRSTTPTISGSPRITSRRCTRRAPSSSPPCSRRSSAPRGRQLGR